MTWKPGESGNPKGRKLGSKNCKTRAILAKINKRGDVDALALLSEVVSKAQAPLALRITAATALAPYQHPRAPRLVSRVIRLPVSETIADATACIAHIGQLAATMPRLRLAFASVNSMAAMRCSSSVPILASMKAFWMLTRPAASSRPTAQRNRLTALAARLPGAGTTIKIEGGLPQRFPCRCLRSRWAREARPPLRHENTVILRSGLIGGARTTWAKPGSPIYHHDLCV